MNQTISAPTTYNGWTNYETWNVSHWMNNDEGFYSVLQDCEDVYDFIDFVITNGNIATPDGVEWDSPEIDFNQLNEVIFSD